MTQPDASAAAVVGACIERGLTLATAESLTAGLLAASIADVPGCSAVLRGGIVAYQADIKAALLGVPDEALALGVVSRAVAEAMAAGAARALGADIGVATTGVAGPDPHDGEPVGSVWIAVAGPSGLSAQHLALAGGRRQVRRQTVTACLAMVMEIVSSPSGSSPGRE